MDKRFGIGDKSMTYHFHGHHEHQKGHRHAQIYTKICQAARRVYIRLLIDTFEHNRKGNIILISNFRYSMVFN